MYKKELPVNEIRLTKKEIETILDRLDARRIDAGHNKRRSKRHPLRGMALLVTVTDHGKPTACYEVRTHNISLHGVGFISQTPIMLGTVIWIQLPIGKDGQVVRKEAIIMRCRHVHGMIYEMGAEFGHHSNQ